METTRIAIAINSTPHTTAATMATVRTFDLNESVRNRVCEELLELTKLAVTHSQLY